MTTTTESSLRQRIESTATPLAMLRQAAAAHPDKAAIEFLHSPLDPEPRILTYRDLLNEVEAACRALHAAGVRRGDGIGMLLPPIPEAIVTLIAAMEVGVVIPLNMLLSADAIAAQLRLARAKVVIVLGPHAQILVRQQLKQAAQSVPTLERIVEVSVEETSEDSVRWDRFLADHRNGRPVPEASADPHRATALFHSGGTTGAPKLAELSERNVVAGALMAAAAIGWRSDDRILLPFPMFHVAGAIDGALGSIAAGATVILPTLLGGRHPQLIPNIWKVVEHTRASVVALVPTSLIAAAEVPVGDCRLQHLRAIGTGSAPLLPATAARIERTLGKPIVQVYGMTETSGITASQPVDGVFREPAVGVPAPLMELRLDLSHAAAAGRGEVCVRGPNVFTGYRTESGTVSVLRDGWLPSGDLGEFDADSQLRLCGRSKDVIIRGGHNVDPLMIEDVANSHPDVVQSVAVAMPDGYAGEVPTLFVIVRAGASTTSDAIARFVAERIAEPPARPKLVTIIAEMPLTPIGKIARFKLRQAAAVRCAQEALARLPIAAVECSDIAAKRMQLSWHSHATAAERELASKRLESLGLTAA